MAEVVKFKKPVPTEPITKQVIRPELNIEKMAQIWQPAKTVKKLNKIVVERPNGGRIQVTANTEYGAPTTETQKILYSLYQISEEQGHPRRFYFSERKIAKVLKKKWGNTTKKIIDTGLYQLRFTAFVLSDVFFDAADEKTLKLIKTFTLLSSLETAEELGYHTTKQDCYAEFNEYIYNNLIKGYTKPLLFENLLTLGDDGIAQIFYTHIDTILATEELPLGLYKRLSKDLFHELNLIAKDYEKLNFRKKTLERVKDKLDKKKLSKGGVIEITIEKSKDDQDYLIIAKSVLEQLPLIKEEKPTEQLQLTSTNGTPSELVQYFHKKFFKLDDVEAQSSELKQATDLMKKYGFETAKFVVDYAFKEAEKTNFQIAVFGGILGYAGRAAAKWKKDREQLEKARKAEERDKQIGACKLGCWKNNGKIFWTKTTDGDPIVANMDCLHDEIKHREEEQRLNIKIAMNREALKS